MSPTVIEIIEHCQKRIKKDPPEDKLLRYIERLRKLEIQIKDLQETGIGRTINQLSRLEGRVGQSAWELVSKWKAIVEAQKSDSSGAESESDASSNEEEDRLVIDDDDQPNEPNPPKPLEDEEDDEQEQLPLPQKSEEKHHKHSKRESSPFIEVRQKSPDPVPDHHHKLTKREPPPFAQPERKSPVPERHHHHHHKRNKSEVSGSNSHEQSTSNSSTSNHHSKRKIESYTPDKKPDSKKIKTEHQSSPKKETKSNNETATSKPKVLQRLDSEISEIDSTSGLNFADVLGCLDSKSKAKNKISKRHKEKDTPEKILKITNGHGSKYEKEKPRIGSSILSSSSPVKPKSSVKPYEPENNITKVIESLADDDNDTEWAAEMNNMWFGNTESNNREDGLETMSKLMSSRNQRTKVYSGNKTAGGGQVPSLFNMCLKVIQDNIDQLGHTGGVPFEILEPVLTRTSVTQLLNIENYNPYLIEDTGKLWKFHCSRDFRGQVPDELESWRELYLRCVDERDKRFASLTNKLKSKLEVATPVRKTKLAYVDTQSGPKYKKEKAAAIKTGMTSLKIRDEKGRQHGGHGSSASAGGKNNQQNIKLEEASVIITGKKARNSAVASIRETTSASISAAAKKPKKAPLMQKTLKSLKSLMRR